MRTSPTVPAVHRLAALIAVERQAADDFRAAQVAARVTPYVHPAYMGQENRDAAVAARAVADAAMNQWLDAQSAVNWALSELGVPLPAVSV